MGGRVALARARTPRPSQVADRSGAGDVLEPVPDRPPRTHVLRLLLGPDDLGEQRIRGDERRRGLDRKRVELLQLVQRLCRSNRSVPHARRCRSTASPSRVRVAGWCGGRRPGRRSPGGTCPPSAPRAVTPPVFRRSSPFGVMTTRGRAVASRACRRSRWKNCPAVVQFTTRMFSCAASCRNRSSLALECSGSVPFVAVRQQEREA